MPLVDALLHAPQIKLLEGSPEHLLVAAEILRASAQLFSDTRSNGQALVKPTSKLVISTPPSTDITRGHAFYSQAWRARSGKEMQSIEPRRVAHLGAHLGKLSS